MAPFTLSVRALSGGATLEVDGADTIATVKKKFDAALVEIDQKPMKGLSLWHENARLDESRTLQSYGVGAGAVLQALATEHDVEAALREEREAEERARTWAERSFGWKANYGMLVSKAEGERRRREALEQARDVVQLGPAQLKVKYGAKFDTVRDARAARARAAPPRSERGARGARARR